MEINNGRLFYATGIDNSQLRSDAAESRSILQSIGSTATQEGANIDAAFGKIAKAAGGIFALSQATSFAKQIISVRGEIESLQISFETLAGKTKGNELFGEIRQFAVSTPMMMKDLAAGAQTMLAFNIEIEKVMPMLRAIGDISMGDAQKFNSLSLAFSQMSATGKLMGQDLLQMINAGFNPLSVISEKTGKSIGELKDEMEKGKITVAMVEDAFITATSEGGKFYQMLLKQSHGVNGAISNLEGAIDDMFNDLGEKMQGTLVTATQVGTYLVQHYEPILDTLAAIVAAYGTYRAALMVNAALEAVMAKARAEQISLIETEINAIGVKTAQEQLSTDADIAAAVAKGQLTEAQGLQILALKQEATARVQALQLAARQAAADAAAATVARQSAGARLQAAEANATAMRIEYQAALAKGEVFEIAVAKERMETAQSEINAASQHYQAAVTAETTAAKAAQTAHTTANTAAQELNNIQVQAGTVQTGIFASAIRLLNNTLKSLWATMMKHPVAALLAAVVALGIAIYNVTKRTNELSAEQRILDDVTGKASSAVAEEKTRIETLSKIVHDNTKELKERKKALDLLQQIVPDYHAALTKEGNLINDNTDALNRYIEALMKAAKLEAIKGGITETFKELTSAAMDVKAGGSDWGWFFSMLSTDESIEKNKQKWADWFDKFTKDPLGKDANGNPYIKKGSDGKTHVLIGDFYMHADMGDDWITEDQRKLIQAAEKYAEYSRIYQDILKEDVTTKAKADDKPTVWQTEVKKQRKALKDAQADLKTLKESASATTAEVKDAQDRVDKAKKALKKLGINVDIEKKSNDKSHDVAVSNADMLAKEAADRRKQTEEYTKQVADQVVDSEYEIRQARIDAMKDGIEKELMQNQLNYDRLNEQNKRRLRDMLDDLADQRIRDAETANPTIFKKKTDDGKWEEAPGKREEMYRTIRLGLTVDDLKPEQQKQIEEFSRVAQNIYEKANQDTLNKMLGDVLTYEQQRLKITEEYQKKRDALYETESYTDPTDGKVKTRFKTDADGNRIMRKGVTEGNLEELNRQQEEALKAIDEQFAQREETYQAWCERITNLSLDRLKTMFAEVEAELQEMAEDGDVDESTLIRFRAMRNTLDAAVKKGNATDKINPGKRTLKEWEDLYKTLNDIEKEFEAIGDACGGTIGEIVSDCGQLTTSTLSMISSITQLANWSVTATEMAAKGVSKTVQTLEKASVILTVITAAMQIASQIANMFNDDEAMQKEIENLQDRIDQLEWELSHKEIMRYTSTVDSLKLVKDSVEATRLELAKLNKVYNHVSNAFIGRMYSVSKNTEWLNLSTQKLADTYAQLGYTADKALGAKRYEEARGQLENLAKQQILISEQIRSEESKKHTDHEKISEWEQKIAELGQQAIELINGMVEDIIGYSASDIAEELGDAFIEAFQAGEDAAEAWGDKVNEIVADILKRMLVQKFLEEPLGEIFNKYKAKWFPNGQAADNFLDVVINSMSSLANDLNSTIGKFNAAMDYLPDELKQYFMGDDSKREASEKGIATASQDSVDELNGRMTAVQGHTFSISENTKLLLSTTQAILRSVMNIEEETEGFGARFERIEGNIKEMNSTLDDIATKGIRLKT